MRNAIQVVLNDQSNRNILALMTGTGLAQLIPLVVSPVLSRVYSPVEFGVFALFIACVSSLSVIATGRYELAIMLPHKDADAINIAALSISVNVVVSTLLIAIATGFHGPIATALGNVSISAWLYLVPLAVLLNGFYTTLNYWCNRNKLYRQMARRRVLQSGGTSAGQLGLGLVGENSGGLIFGSIFGQVLSCLALAKVVRSKSSDQLVNIDGKRMIALAQIYKSCPLLLAPAHTISALSIQLPVVFINALFGSAASGFFMLADRVIGMPVSLMSTSIGDVFRQEISECYLNGRRCKTTFLSTFRKLAIIATPPFAILVFFAPPLFALVFGERWRVSGEYAQLMCPMIYTRFISNPLSIVAIVAQKNRFELLWQAALLIALACTVVSKNVMHLDSMSYVIVFSFICVAFDIVNLIACYTFACAGDRRVLDH